MKDYICNIRNVILIHIYTNKSTHKLNTYKSTYKLNKYVRYGYEYTLPLSPLIMIREINYW